MAEKECPFCKIVSGEVPSSKIYEDENTIAFLDINPRNPGHALIIPKKHYETVFEISEEEAGELFLIVKKIAAAVKDGTKADGVSISQSNGRAAGQLVPHMHFHVIPRFNAEGPIGLEGVLPVKKLPKEATDKIMENIKNSLESPSKPEKKEETKETEEEPGKEATEEDIDFDF